MYHPNAYALGRTEIARQNREAEFGVPPSGGPAAPSPVRPSSEAPQFTLAELDLLHLLAIIFREMGGWMSGNALRAMSAFTPVDIERRGWITRKRGSGVHDGEGWIPAGALADLIHSQK